MNNALDILNEELSRRNLLREFAGTCELASTSLCYAASLINQSAATRELEQAKRAVDSAIENLQDFSRTLGTILEQE